MSCDRMTEWEADKWEELAEKFTKKHEDLWHEFLSDEFQEYEAGYADYQAEMYADMIRENEVD